MGPRDRTVIRKIVAGLRNPGNIIAVRDIDAFASAYGVAIAETPTETACRILEAMASA